MLRKKFERQIDESFFVNVFKRLTRLRQIEPGRVVNFVIVACRISGKIPHEKKRNGLAVFRFPNVKPVRDLAEPGDDLAPATRLFPHFAQRGLFGRFADFDMPFGQRPDARRVAAPDENGLVDRVAAPHEQTARRHLVLDAHDAPRWTGKGAILEPPDYLHYSVRAQEGLHERSPFLASLPAS